MTLSDQELICGLMEPKPSPNYGPNSACHTSPLGWWVAALREGCEYSTVYRFKWVPHTPTLNECHEVEERLIASVLPVPAEYADWADRIDTEICKVMGEAKESHYHWHATAEQKIRALAAVLRKEEPQ